MKKSKTTILKIASLFTVFFTCINIVNAWESKNFNVEYGDNLYARCNESNKCIPICIYSANKEVDADITKNNGEVAYIGYYYSGKSEWEIGFVSLNNMSGWVLTYTNSTILPATDIYWSNFRNVNNDKQVTWNKATENSADGQTVWKPYDKLKSDFQCPNFINRDNINSAGTTELCLSNIKETCRSQNDITGTHFDVEGDRALKSSFDADVKKVIEDTYNKLFIFGADSSDIAYVDPDVNKKIDFLLAADSNFKKKYDTNKSGQDNLKDYCPILAENLKDEDKYFSSLSGNVTDYRDMINKQLQESATTLGVRNKEVYTDETLSSLLTLVDSSGNKKYRQIVDESTGQTYIEKLHSLYAQNTIKSLNYARDLCNTIQENNIKYDEAKLKNMLTTNYETTVYENVKLDTDTTFDCGTLGELADLVKTGYFIIEIVALVILIVFTVLDYAKVILSGEQDEMKKTNKRLKTRLIIMIVILLLPALINFVLGVFNIEGFNSENPLCVEIKNK